MSVVTSAEWASTLGSKMASVSATSPAAVAEPLAGGKKDHQRKTNRQQPGGQPHLEDQPLAAAVVAGQPVAAVQVGLGLELAILRVGGIQRFRPSRGSAASSLTSGGCSGLSP